MLLLEAYEKPSSTLGAYWNRESLLLQAVDNATQVIQSRLSYQIPLFVLLAIPTVTLAILPFVPESPVGLALSYGHQHLLSSAKSDGCSFRDMKSLRSDPFDFFEKVQVTTLHFVMNSMQ